MRLRLLLCEYGLLPYYESGNVHLLILDCSLMRQMEWDLYIQTNASACIGIVLHAYAF